ncbi:hypothetical protein I3760_10G057700 [Carya illinoinensis]|uniref:TFIIB-type domain-containing protein n=1 Tax=Carya illinoinensis TaxID=32201 RepID=A0A8T1P9F3_CARIL|nr:hypothetical protein I3760_10G057700 [Carya illinoinensis]KAG6638798.1 hypothetical protein CIPAW_10G058500 [Carya illinoinensis]
MSSGSCGCNGCRSKSLVRDDITGSLVCSACGLVQEFDNFDAQLGGLNGPQGTFVRVGTAGLSSSKSNDVKTMIATITENEFGQGDWFPILIGACSYVVMRKDNKLLPIAEVASIIGCDIFELGRMVSRVVDFLDLKGPEEFPEFDIVASFERTVRNSPRFTGVGRDKVARMLKQGIFLIQCAVKWFLTTGRRPLPVVAAVLVLVAELNGVDVRIDDVAKDVHATASTCRLRYRELLESLVKVAQVLPWGKDVTLKNVVKNAPFVIQYMERKSMEKPVETRNTKGVEGVGVDLGDVVSQCLRKDVKYGTDLRSVENDSRYFEVEKNSGYARSRDDDLDRMTISHECLSLMYTEFLNEMSHSKSIEGDGEVRINKTMRGFEPRPCRDWWNGKSELTKKLLLKQILEKDVGLDALPPSFVSGCRDYKRRKKRIDAAKWRINRVLHPSRTDSVDSGDIHSEYVDDGKKRKRKRIYDIDWEDLIIETLLLHGVNEEEIEKGHYNTLLDLHVFNGGIVPQIPSRKE